MVFFEETKHIEFFTRGLSKITGTLVLIPTGYSIDSQSMGVWKYVIPRMVQFVLFSVRVSFYFASMGSIA